MDYYEILEVTPKSSLEVIKAAYKTLAQKYHPDRNSAKEALKKMQEINQAYTTLSDPEKKRQYDELLRQKNNFKQVQQSEVKKSSVKNQPPTWQDKKVQEGLINWHRSCVKEIVWNNFDNIAKQFEINKNLIFSYHHYLNAEQRKYINMNDFILILKDINDIHQNIERQRVAKFKKLKYLKAGVAFLLGLIVTGIMYKIFNDYKKDNDYMRANQFYYQKDYQNAFNYYKSAAEKGHVPAQNTVGYMYQMGQGIEKNNEQALKWYKLAATQGNMEAQDNLGNMYLYGIEVKKDRKEALQWYRLAALQGNNYAQEMLIKLKK